ncbi:MAG: RNA polymerase sigma factor RpoD/SigA [Muribaculaceae bacterium]|nr:RNA polymerase sigma factor RpoD/SigA [Bacteroidales bacterium]
MRQLKIAPSITKRDGEILDKYLQEIGREEMLTPDQEVELARRIHEGDRKALDRLVRSNLRFVVSVAKQYQNQGMSLPDLINEGNLGLIKAAEKFDETRGFKFISYAVWWIRQSILQAMSEHSRIVRLPLNHVGAINKIHKAMAAFEQENQRRASPEEIAEMLDIPVEKVRESMRVSGRSVSVDTPFRDGEDGTMLDVMANEDDPGTDSGLNLESLSADIHRALAQLPEREREVLQALFGIGTRELSLEEIGDKYGLTRERVRQIKEKALRHIKLEHSRTLKTYLG